MGVTSVATQLRDAREALRARLALQAIEPAHIVTVEAVANEMLAAAFENKLTEPLILSVELSARCTTVRVRCRRNVELHDEPFRMRARVLDGLAHGYGTRHGADGSAELWAELARPSS